MLKNDEISRYILDYMAGEKELGPGRDQQTMFRRSHSLHTCRKLYSLVKNSPNENGVKVIERYLAKLNDCVYKRPSYNDRTGMIFIVMADTTQDILDGLDVMDRLDLGGKYGKH